MIKDRHFDKAGFFYYLGLLRYRYYNSANPAYKDSDDGALLASFHYVLGEPVNAYLKTSVGRMLAVLNAASDFYKNNDYPFFPKQHSTEKYNQQLEGYTSLLEDLKTNKLKYQKEWDADRILMLANLDKAIDEYNHPKK